LGVDGQALAVAGKTTFYNCLVAMRPKAGTLDLPSTHDITTYIHNEFVEWLTKLKVDITVSNYQGYAIYGTNLGNPECSWQNFLNCGWVDCRQYKGIVFGDDSALD